MANLTDADKCHSRLQISVIDDHSFLVDALSEWLTRNARDIQIVGSYTNWSDAAAHMQGLGDVVLLDVILGDDIPLNSKIRAIMSAGTQVVTMSTIADVTVIRQAMSAGAKAFVAKSARPSVVLDALRSAARGESYPTQDHLPGLVGERPLADITPREHQIVTLYLGPRPRRIDSVAAELRISRDAVKKHLKNVRRKYTNAGAKVSSRLALRQQLINDRWIIVRGNREDSPTPQAIGLQDFEGIR